MAGLIPQAFIDDLIARTDIVEVIDAHVPLRKAGRDYKACCPFHDEKSPSFTVSQSKQFYHCFGCGAHGTVLRFLMDFERMDFVEAVEELAARHSLTVPREGGGTGPGAAQRSRVDAALAALEQATAWYKRQLREHEDSAAAKDYLRHRGMSGRTAARFELGFAPAGWDLLSRRLREDGVSDEALRDAGLLSESERSGTRTYDRFRDRVMFPIHDRRGRVVGFGARTMGDATPKYLNSPETLVFHKGQELYGLHHVLRQRGLPAQILVVEGYMDVVMLWEHDVHYACATLGTAATPEQMERLFRSSSDVVFCFDGDAAGRRAAWRALENALPQMRDGRRARFMFLPEGEDPDSYVRGQGRQAFEQLLGEAPTLTEFLFQELRRDNPLRSVEGRARLIDDARPLLLRLPDGALRSMAIQRLGELCHMSVERIEGLFGLQGSASSARAAGAELAAPARGREVVTPARRAVTLLLHHPDLARACDDVDDIGGLEVAGAALLHDLIEAARDARGITTGGLLERFRNNPAHAALERLATQEAPDYSAPLQEEFLDCLERLRRSPLEARYLALQQRAREDGLNASEADELAALLKARAGVTDR
jgi:DNA primase